MLSKVSPQHHAASSRGGQHDAAGCCWILQYLRTAGGIGAGGIGAACCHLNDPQRPQHAQLNVLSACNTRAISPLRSMEAALSALSGLSALQDNYTRATGVSEETSARETKEQWDFLNACMETKPMQYCFKYLVAKVRLPPAQPSEDPLRAFPCHSPTTCSQPAVRIDVGTNRGRLESAPLCPCCPRCGSTASQPPFCAWLPGGSSSCAMIAASRAHRLRPPSPLQSCMHACAAAAHGRRSYHAWRRCGACRRSVSPLVASLSFTAAGRITPCVGPQRVCKVQGRCEDDQDAFLKMLDEAWFQFYRRCPPSPT